MSHFFPNACLVACVRHLHDNVVSKVDSLIGTRDPVRHSVIDGIFGIASAMDMISLDVAVAEYIRIIMPNALDGFNGHFTKVVGLLRGNVVAGRVGWTNNNCESVNHVLKQYVQWRPQQLSDLVRKLQ